jgi:hypothetical protein
LPAVLQQVQRTRAAPRLLPEAGAETDDRQILPLPSLKITRAKVVDRIDPHISTIISLSPYIVMATSDAAGRTDASPRGGPAGFVKVLDDRHLLIPELSGNRRADTLTNLLETPFIGLMFLIPGY